MLRWLRDDIGLKVDPVDMFNEDGFDYVAPCGCEFGIGFEMESVSWIKSLRLGARSAAAANIGCEPCQQHRASRRRQNEWTHREWNGRFSAWRHDPKRPNTIRER